MPERDKDGNIIASPPMGKYTRVDSEIVEVGALHKRAGELARKARSAPTDALIKMAVKEAKENWPEHMTHADMCRNFMNGKKYNTVPKTALMRKLKELAREMGRTVKGDRSRTRPLG